MTWLHKATVEFLKRFCISSHLVYCPWAKLSVLMIPTFRLTNPHLRWIKSYNSHCAIALDIPVEIWFRTNVPKIKEHLTTCYDYHVTPEQKLYCFLNKFNNHFILFTMCIRSFLDSSQHRTSHMNPLARAHVGKCERQNIEIYKK